PADFHSGEEIRLRPRQLEQSLRLEIPLAEDLAIGDERNGGPAPVRRAAEPLKRRLGMSALELLREELPVARHFDADVAAQRVDHTDADPVQTAAGGIGLARELAARVQRGEDHLERRLARKLRVLVDRDAAAVVADRQAVAFVECDL